MALRMDFVETRNGLSGELRLSNAYWRIDQVVFSKAEAVCVVSVYDREIRTRVGGKNYVFKPQIGDRNALADAYDHLKTLPEFAGAVDC